MEETALSTEVLNQQVALNRNPQDVLNDALNAAKSLQQVIRGKKKPVIFNGEQYLEFEDWQTCARFYGLSVKVISTNFVQFGEVQGWEAKAEVLRNADGAVISAADSMCLNDEPNWSKKPLFQLRSMAQTRACAKALRNVLAWVAVLAGFKPTPAEEMDSVRTIPTEQTTYANPENAPEGDLSQYVMPAGKYKGQTLSVIADDMTDAGKPKGMEYLQWCITPEAKVKQEIKDVIAKFLKDLNG